MGSRTWWRRVGVAGVVALTVALAVGLGAGAATAPVTVKGVRPEAPDVSGLRMVWADVSGESYDVFLYDASSGKSEKIAATADDEFEPAISGDTVVYTRRTSSGADIYVYDIPSRTTSIVTNASGDQHSPAVSGTYVAWIDQANGYHGQVWGRNLASGTPFRIDSGYSIDISHPEIGASILVYQTRPGGLEDADVKAYDFGTGAFKNIAATDAEELLPDTDGRYVVWAQDSGGDMNIKAYDLQGGETFDVRAQIGEQTLPRVADGIVYWVDNMTGKRLHVDKYDIETSTFSAFDNRSASDMVAVAAQGSSIAWLETKGGDGWQVKAYLDGASAAGGIAGGAVPTVFEWSPFRLAQISTGGDSVPPEVVDATVDAGDTKVDADGGLAVYFSEALDPGSVSGDTVGLRNEATGEEVEATVAYSTLAGAVTVKPSTSLAEGTYTLGVETGVKDEAGNNLLEPVEFTFSTGGEIAADTTRPTQPGSPVARVNGTDEVEVSWLASSDNVGIAYYRVYRYTVPGGTLLGWWQTVDGSATSLSVPKHADETVPKKYTYYYSVRAFDAAANQSTMSSYTSPDPHGTYIFGAQVNNCSLCHKVHGGGRPSTWWALGAQSAEACYLCHGGTSAATGYGYASTKDAQAKFWDYSATPLPEGGSRHRNTYMEAQRQECDACHTPHRKPYNESGGVKDPATSYSKLLKRPSDPATTTSALVYSTDDNPFDEVFCFACHGSSAGGSLTYMNEKGGSEAYSNTAGDHNQAQYDAAGNPSNVAHDDEVVLYTQRDPASNPGPLTNCQACHNEHAAPSSSLADYRSSGTTASTYRQAGLCYACHSASSVETRSVGAVPFAWNGRDVRAQFTKTSKHPTSAKTGSPVPEGGSWLQTTEEHFATDTHTRTEVVAGGSGTSGAVQLAPFGGAAGTVFEDDFETGDFSKWDSSNWGIDGSAANAHGGSNSAVMNTTGADELMVKTVDTAGRTNVQISFWLKGTNTTENTDYIQLQVYNTGTTTWDTIRNIPLDDQVTTYRQFVDSIPASYYSATMQFRILGRCNVADEYQHVDDVAVTADPIAGSFEPNGNVVSTPVLVTGGTLNSWSMLRYTGNQPTGSTFRVDVLDGADSSVLVSDLTLADTPYSLAGIDEVAHPSLKVRARFVGDAPAPPSVSDDFNDNSFDTSKWTDLFINSTDPDSGAPVPWSSVAEPFTNLGNWTVQQSNDNEWVSQGGDGNPAPCAEVHWRTGGSTNRVLAYMTRVYDTSGKSDLYVTFDWRQSNTTFGDSLLIDVSTDGSSWTPLWTEGDATPTNWTSASTAAGTVPASSTLYVRFGGALRSSGRYYRVDNFQIHGTAPGTPTSLWPDESGGQLTIKAEGSDFGGTADEGEFTYVKPTVASWIAGNDFEAVVYVPSYNNLGANGWMKTGLMLRTGTTEANAQAAGAKMAGIYVTDTNGINFEYRTTAGGASASGGTQAGDAPMWLKLGRVGNVITGYMSADGSSWTPVGSQTVSLDTYVLVGVCLTSHVNGTFSEATFDDFSVTQLGGSGSTVTPRLDDWSVDYIWTPSPTGSGSLTCYNCHNTHYVQRGAAGAVWSMTRASNPDNTKSAYTGTVTSFCLKCHDGAAPTAVTNQSNTLVPYNVIMSDMSAYPFFPGWNKSAANVEWTNSGHANSGVDNMTPGCESCHDPHASDNQRLTAATAYYVGGGSAPAGHIDARRDNSSTYAEEALCYVCHLAKRAAPNCTGGTCHTDIDSQPSVVMNIETAFGYTYKHPVALSGRHSDTEDSSGVGDSNRHSECVDCHDPHAARAGIHADNSSVAGNVLRGATGVKPTSWPAETASPFQSAWDAWALGAGGYQTVRLDGDADDYEAYACFKCHSSYTTQPSSYTRNSVTYTPTDVAREFNPNNQSGHNVLGNVWPKTSFNIGGSTYDWPLWTGGFQTGYDTSEMLTCTSCHEGEGTASGPHGSSQPYLVDSAYTTAWNSTGANLNRTNGLPTTLICYKCHNNIREINDVHRQHDDRGSEGGYCRFCHVGIPHGWKRPRLIGYTTDPDPYATWRSSSGQSASGDYGVTEIDLQGYTPSGWRDDNCYAGCEGSGRHADSDVLIPWP